MGLFGSGATLGPPTGQLAPSNYLPTVPRPGFFDQGGLGSKLARGANAFATNWLAMDGNQGAEDQLQQQRALQNAAILRAQSLQDGRDTWLMQQKYKAENPEEDPTYLTIVRHLGEQAGAEYLRRKGDPDIALTLPNNGVYSGPRSGLGVALGGQQAPEPAQPPAAQRGGHSMSTQQVAPMLQSLGPNGFLAWQQKNNVPVLVNSPEEAAALPAGTQMMSPDGRVGVKH